MSILAFIFFVAMFLVGLVTIARFLWQFLIAWDDWSDSHPRKYQDDDDDPAEDIARMASLETHEPEWGYRHWWWRGMKMD